MLCHKNTTEKHGNDAQAIIVIYDSFDAFSLQHH